MFQSIIAEQLQKIWMRKGLPGFPPAVAGELFVRGNLVVVILNNTYMGWAKRNPRDKFNIETGLHLAAHRALDELLFDQRASIVEAEYVQIPA